MYGHTQVTRVASMSKTTFAARTGNRAHIVEEKRSREKIGMYNDEDKKYAVRGKWCASTSS